MNLTVAYRGRSVIVSGRAGLAVSLAPNLRRDRVAFDGTLRHPVRFREAIGALHDIVVSDLRFMPRDKSAYEAYAAEQKRRQVELRQAVVKQARTAILEAMPELPDPFPEGFDRRLREMRTLYWKSREKYANHLSRHDPELWRLLMPCDPVITVAPDVLFFECFSADESSYGCLNVEREAFESETDVALGTNNVDYSYRLYEHFQTIRSYRETRFTIDPTGLEVQTPSSEAVYREEKIDLPQSWLRGFSALQSAMSLPMRRVPVSREGVYA